MIRLKGTETKETHQYQALTVIWEYDNKIKHNRINKTNKVCSYSETFLGANTGISTTEELTLVQTIFREINRDDHIRTVVGKLELGKQNNGGERILQICIDINFILTNTKFQHHKRRLYTWNSQGDRYSDQMDQIDK